MSKILPVKPRGARKRLWSLNYATIADWVGLAPRSVIQYASRGDFDSSNLESVLSWANKRRRRRGLPMIGLPPPEHSEGEDAPDIPPIPSNYNPLTGEFD